MKNKSKNIFKGVAEKQNSKHATKTKIKNYLEIIDEHLKNINFLNRQYFKIISQIKNLLEIIEAREELADKNEVPAKK